MPLYQACCGIVLVTVFLLRGHINRFDDAIDPDSGATEFAGAAALNFQCRFFLGPQRSQAPSWFEFVSPGLVRPLPNLVQAGVSGVLVLQASNRLFAVTFGHGRYVLASGVFEEDFGLKVALNRIDENDLKSIDTKTYDEIVTTSKTQVSRDAGLENFGVDVARDILRAVQGRPKNPLFATRLSGADSVALSRPGLQFDELGALCSELLVAYGETTYQAKFKWVDNVKQVRDIATLRTLDAALVVAMNARTLGSMHLTLGDDSGLDIEAYAFRGAGAAEFRNLDLGAYLHHAAPARRGQLTSDMLKSHRVKVRYAGAAEFELGASMYESLVWETTISGDTYAFFDGRWFRVERNFSTEVQNYWRGLPRCAFALPVASILDSEGDYNAGAAAAMASIALFDKVRLTSAAGFSPIEFCDLMSDQGHLIHVKWRYSSATFSHLFAQGSVSVETFLREDSYRQQIVAKLTAWGKTSHLPLVPRTRPTAGNYEVVYAIIAPATASNDLLPFFSAVNLRQHGQRLSTVGVRVSLYHIVAQ
jgi:uncharacterized protein (TIGR04141 family)